MGYLWVVQPKDCRFLAVLVRDRVSILAVFVSCVLHSNLELCAFLKEATFSTLSIRPLTKALHNTH